MYDELIKRLRNCTCGSANLIERKNAMKVKKSHYLKLTDPKDRDLLIQHKLWNLPEVSEEQAEMMLHAIGADHNRVRNYLGKQYYHAFRNFYDAGGNDVAQWENLVQLGYAMKRTFYHVTPYGFDILELLTGRTTIYDNYWNYADCRNAVLNQFLKDDVAICYGCWFPTSAVTVSHRLHIPLGLVREACRNLVSEGFLIKGYDGGMDDDGCVHCYHGYYITDKARQLEKWKTLYEQEIAYINNMNREGSENNS